MMSDDPPVTSAGEQADAGAAATRLWHRYAEDAGGAEVVAMVADRVYSDLRSELGRWIGVDGFHSLLDRALRLARVEYPALDGLTHLGGEDPRITDAVNTHGAAEVTAGMRGVLTVLIDLLGRIVGTEMAVRLIDQVGVPSPRGIASTELEDPLND